MGLAYISLFPSLFPILFTIPSRIETVYEADGSLPVTLVL